MRLSTDGRVVLEPGELVWFRGQLSLQARGLYRCIKIAITTTEEGVRIWPPDGTFTAGMLVYSVVHNGSPNPIDIRVIASLASVGSGIARPQHPTTYAVPLEASTPP